MRHEYLLSIRYIGQFIVDNLSIQSLLKLFHFFVSFRYGLLSDIVPLLFIILDENQLFVLLRHFFIVF